LQAAARKLDLDVPRREQVTHLVQEKVGIIVDKQQSRHHVLR
jgi:hypothetical protein